MRKFNFLGIILDENLSWKPHIEFISSKIAQTIGIMNRLKLSVPTFILLNLYNSLILPRLNYGLLIWGSQTSRIFKVQKKAIRIVNLAKYNSHTEPLFKSCRLLNINDLYKVRILDFYYNLIHKKLPHYFLTNFNLEMPSKNHSYNTRNRSKIYSRRTNLKFTEKCLQHEIAPTFNSIPSQLQEQIFTHSRLSFRKNLKIHFLNLYSPTCHIKNCYICQNP